MPHPLVDQIRFTRREWLRGLAGLPDADALQHFGPMNCISWMVGHLAWHEQRSWLQFGQGRSLFPHLNELFAYQAPMSSPALPEMLDVWRAVTEAADPYLDQLDTTRLQAPLLRDGRDVGQSVGSALRRITYHYWYHLGEILAICQMMGHAELPDYVGALETEAPYRAE